MPTADPFAAPRPGEVSPFVVSLNTIGAALEALRNLPSPRGQLRASDDEINQRLPTPHASVLVRNDTGASVPALSVLKLGTTIQSITTQQHDIFRLPAFEGTTPEAQSDQFCVLLVGAAAGQISEAAIRGVAVCYVTVSDITHLWAAPDPGSTAQLLSGESGPARILSTLTGTGRQLCAVLIDDRGDRQVREVVSEEPLNSEPATEETLYAADEPTTATPAVQFSTAQNLTGGVSDLPGGYIAGLPEGTAGDAAYYLEWTTETVSQTVTIDGSSSTTTYTENAGDITLALSVDIYEITATTFDLTNVTTLDLTGVSVTGFSGGGQGQGTVAATGNNQGNAALLTNDTNEVTGADGTKGVRLDTTFQPTTVYNNSASLLLVYPPSGEQISALGTNNADSIAAGGAEVYTRLSTTLWKSVGLF